MMSTRRQLLDTAYRVGLVLLACQAIVVAWTVNQEMSILSVIIGGAFGVTLNRVLRLRQQRRRSPESRTIPVLETPRNVRIVAQDGTVLPLELVYVGWNGRGHEWRVTSLLRHDLGIKLLDGDGPRLVADEIPANTYISIELAQR
jgi:hypothetical protein